MNVYSKSQFLNQMKESKYYHKFARVPTLLDSFGELLNKYSNNVYDICIGIAENFDLKYSDGNVICRMEEDGNNVKVSGRLNGSSIGIDKKGFYIAIRRKYYLMKSKHHIVTSSDVNTLIEIIEKFISKNQNYKQENNG